MDRITSVEDVVALIDKHIDEAANRHVEHVNQDQETFASYWHARLDALESLRQVITGEVLIGSHFEEVIL